jgi:hypothetical protein
VGNSILRFDDAFTDSGNIVPAATITGGLTTLNAPAFITLDAVADRLYVANNSDSSVLVFDNISTKNGNVAPDRTISGPLVTPTDVSIDTTKDLLYVADDTDILVFASASTATGNATPVQDLTVSFTIAAIFIDAAHDRLYVADAADNAIDVFDNASTLPTGNITASRTIQGAATHLATPGGVQLDGSGRLIVSNALAGAPSITIYANAATATGNVAPLGEIKGNNTGLNSPDQIAVDTSGLGTVYNVDSGAARVAAFTNLGAATGNIAPARAILGSATGLTTSARPVGVALDNTR